MPYPTQLCGGPADGEVIDRAGDRYFVQFNDPMPIVPMVRTMKDPDPARSHVYELRLAQRPDRSVYWRYEYRGVE